MSYRPIIILLSKATNVDLTLCWLQVSTKNPHSERNGTAPVLRTNPHKKRTKQKLSESEEFLPPGACSGPVFVQMEVLKPRDVFVSIILKGIKFINLTTLMTGYLVLQGLNMVSFDDDKERTSTVVSLVSTPL